MPSRARARITRTILAADGRLPWLTQILLVLEILLAYARTRPRMARQDIRILLTQTVRRPARKSACIAIDEKQARIVALRLGRAVYRTLTPLPTDSRCLAQSLVLSALLASRDIDSKLVIGARSRPDFKAHAWVEHGGLPVLPEQGFGDGRLVEL